MRNLLDASRIDDYRERGVLFPIDVLDAGELADLKRRHDAVAPTLVGRLNQKPHLLFTWLDRLIRHPRILDAVESLHGPDLLCWGAQFFAKPAGHPSYVSWHQDATYWGLSSPDVVTAWVALTPSTPQSGCMKVVPGTHLRQVEHVDQFADANLLSRGQEIAVEVDEDAALDVVLAPGQMSLHHVLLFHGSEPNTANHSRVGFAIRYIPTRLKQLSGIRDSATLVRGEDRYGHFDAETAPRSDLAPEAVAHHRAVVDQQMRILYAGSGGRGKLAPNEKQPDQRRQ